MELFLSRDYQFNWISCLFVIGIVFIKRPPVQLNKFNWISCLFVIGIVFIKRLPVQLNKLSIRYWNCFYLFVRSFYQETTSSIEVVYSLLELFLSTSSLFVIGIVFIKRPPVQLNKLSIRYWNCFYQETTSSIELSCLFVIGIVFIKRPPVQLNKLSIRYWNCFYQETTSSIE